MSPVASPTMPLISRVRQRWIEWSVILVIIAAGVGYLMIVRHRATETMRRVQCANNADR